jgi:hypothetical protein
MNRLLFQACRILWFRFSELLPFKLKNQTNGVDNLLRNKRNYSAIIQSTKDKYMNS